MRTLIATLAISVLLGCNSRAKGPVPIAPDDACASCRMLISQRRFAAEMLDSDGTIYKFDDIACMMRFAQANGKNSPSVRFYVTDYAGGRDWLDARQAYFVRLRRSSSSPMASGLAAFHGGKDAALSGGAGAEPRVSFNDLWTNGADKENAMSAENRPGSRSGKIHGH